MSELVFKTQEQLIAECAGKADRMYTRLAGLCSDGKHQNLRAALHFAREKHKNQTRKSGEPYIIHPLTLACNAEAMGMYNDVLLAMLILHDVPEDTGVNVMDLPVDDETKAAVECMTCRQMSSESKLESKKRYFEGLAGNKYATIGKGLDRWNNLSTSAQAMGKASIIKNCYETVVYLDPILKDAKHAFPEYVDQIYLIRDILRGLVDTLSVVAGIKRLCFEVPPDDELMARILSAKTEEDLKKIPEIFP